MASFEISFKRNEQLDDQLATYLVNLDCSHQRLQKVSEILRNAEIKFERISAVDGRQRSARQFPQYNQRMALNRYGRPMSGPEVGCFLSHRRCIEAFLVTSKQFALVFEDDISLPVGFNSLLEKVISVAQHPSVSNWDVINLGNSPKKYYQTIKLLDDSSQSSALCRCHYFPLGTFGLLWSRSGAERFLENSRQVYEPIDQFLRDWCARDGIGLAISEPLVGVDRSQSYIRPTWADRLKLNFVRYWIVKNWRLLKNNYRARKSWRAANDLEFQDDEFSATLRLKQPQTDRKSETPSSSVKSPGPQVSQSRKRSA